jgi:hypothetical protein
LKYCQVSVSRAVPYGRYQYNTGSDSDHQIYTVPCEGVKGYRVK